MIASNYDQHFSGNALLNVGSLHVPSGQLVTCDPFFCARATPFKRKVPPGLYAVQLCRMEFKEWGPRIALARVLFKPDTRAASLEKAVMADQSTTSFMVDSGTASFMDEETRVTFSGVLADFYRSHPQGNYYTDVLEADFQKNALTTGAVGDWTMHRLPNSEQNVAIFASGLGDGMYESFWGLAGNGEVTSLVTDFRVIK
jgi:hypothetical protein